MARNRDIKIWKDKFYRELPPLYKCFWDYINDDCDNAGVWLVDPKVASICIGRKIHLTKAMELFGERIRISPCQQKWFITTFIQEKLNFDPAQLNPSNKFQKSIIELLNKHQVDLFKGLGSPLQRAIVKEIVNVKAEASEEGGVGGPSPLPCQASPCQAEPVEAHEPVEAPVTLSLSKGNNCQAELVEAPKPTNDQ